MPLYGLAVAITGLGCLLAALGVGVLTYCLFAPKPTNDYDSSPQRVAFETNVSLIREMLANTRNDDERMAVVDFAFDELDLPRHEVERLLDEALPLIDPHDAAAFSARLYLRPRLQLLG